jgi:hypothetical protein
MLRQSASRAIPVGPLEGGIDYFCRVTCNSRKVNAKPASRISS